MRPAISTVSRNLRHGAAFIGALSVVAIGVAAWPQIGAGRTSLQAELPIRGVRVVTVDLARPAERRQFAAVIAPRWQVPVAFRTGGRIVSRSVEIGERVARGEALFELDIADLRAGVEAARAEMRAAEAQAVQTSADAARQGEIRRKGFATDAQLERSTAAARSAAEALGAARAALVLAENRLGYATLTAPESGIVTAIAAEAGQVVAEGTPVLTLVRTEGLEIRIDVPETMVGQISDYAAKVALWSEPGNSFPITLREVSAAADPVTRTFAVRYEVPELLRVRLMPGMSASVELTRAGDGEVAFLPASALVQAGGESFVWAVGPSGVKAERRNVELRGFSGDRVEVAGLDDGSRVIAIGGHRIDEKLPIRVIEEESPAGDDK
jgi:RND family efflux transporter MFP subunit